MRGPNEVSTSTSVPSSSTATDFPPAFLFQVDSAHSSVDSLSSSSATSTYNNNNVNINSDHSNINSSTKKSTGTAVNSVGASTSPCSSRTVTGFMTSTILSTSTQAAATTAITSSSLSVGGGAIVRSLSDSDDLSSPHLLHPYVVLSLG